MSFARSSVESVRALSVVFIVHGAIAEITRWGWFIAVMVNLVLSATIEYFVAALAASFGQHVHPSSLAQISKRPRPAAPELSLN